MTGPHLFLEFTLLSSDEQHGFLSMLALHLDLGLPDSTHVLLPRDEFERLTEMLRGTHER
jgi:hypothetical protein